MRSLQNFLSSLFSRARTRGSSRRDGSAEQAQAELVDFRLLTENSRDVICRINADTMPVYVSPSVHEVLGWTPEEFMSAGPRFVHPEDESLVRSVNARLIAGEIEEANVSCRMTTRSGSTIWVEANA